LAGGAVNSPQLLLLSGVGPAAGLAAHGIAPVHLLNGVGENLQDHLDISVITRDLTGTSVGLGWKTAATLAAAFIAYRRNSAGMLASNAAEAGGFASLSPQSTRPELQFHFLPTALRDHGRKLSWGYGMTLHVCQLRPASRGTVTLGSAEPLAPPVIQPHYLAADEDLATLLAGLKYAMRIMQAPAFAAQNAGTRLSPPPGLTGDAQLTEFIRNNAETIYHPVGTCRMGDDALAVVDDRLRVHGLSGLRVVDASVMPRLIGGNTNAPVMAIAEKAARFILADRNALAA
jgi:choline dehydrogenase